MKTLNGVDIPDVGEASWYLTHVGDGQWLVKCRVRSYAGDDGGYVASALSGNLFATYERATTKAKALSKAYAKAMKPKEWVPKSGEEFYYVSDYGHVHASIVSAASRVLAGNYFKTEALALAAADKVREVLKGMPHA